MKVYLSDRSFSNKPNSYDTGRITREILSNSVDLNIEEIAKEVSENGKTVMLCQLDGDHISKIANITSQEMVMLDFDNTNEQYSIEDLENDEFMQEYACFMYKTFSDTKSDVDKFRVAFVLEHPVNDTKTIEKIYKGLFEKYPQSDHSVGQTTRLFYGSNTGYEIIDLDNRLPIENYELMSKNEIIDESLPNYILMRYGKTEIIKEKLQDTYSQVFPDEISAYTYFTSIDIREILELPEMNPFIDILHGENSPSASVFLSNTTNDYLYKCFSNGSPFTGDICSLLCKLIDLKSNSHAITYLVDITNSVIDYSSKLGQQKINSNIFRKKLMNGKLQEESPELYSYLKRYATEINATLDVMYDFTYLDKDTGEIKYLNYFSVNTLTNLVGRYTNQKISVGKMWNILNLIIVTEMIEKIPIGKAPKGLYDKLIVKQQNTKQIRTSNIYEPSMLDDGALINTYDIAKVLKDNNVTISGISYELMYRLFGEEKANRDFPQAYEPLEEQGLIKMSKVDNNLTKKSTDFEKLVVKILLKGINDNGYMYEDDLLEKVSKKNKLKKESNRVKYMKLRADVINKYDLKRDRLSKKIANDLKIPSKKIFYKKAVLYLNN